MGYLINSYKGGLAPFDNRGLQGSFKYGKNLDIRKRTDSLSCQQALTDDLATGTMTDTAIAIVPADDGYTYFFCRDGKIYRRASDGTYTLVYTETTGDITGAFQWYNDQDMTFLYWTCKNGSNADLNRKRIINAGTNDDLDWTQAPVVNATLNSQTYPKTNLSGADWHTMRDISGSLIGCNKDKLFLVGYDDSYTNEAVQLIPGNVSKTLMELSKYVLAGCERNDAREESSMFIWNIDSLSWDDRKVLPLPSVNAGIICENPFIQVGSSGYVYYADLQSTIPAFIFPGGGEVNPNGVALDEGLALFGVYGATSGYNGVYSFGRKRREDVPVLNLEYALEADEIGAVCNVGTDILVSYRSGSNYGVKKVDTSNKATAVYESLELWARNDNRDDLPNWTQIKLTMKPLPSDCSVQVARKTDKTGSFEACNTEDGSTEFSVEGATEVIFYAGDDAKIQETQITLNPSSNETPEIYMIEVEYE